MKKFLLVIFLASSLISNAQENTEYQYCELVGTMKLFSPKVNVSVDFGEDTKWFADTRIKDEITGKAAWPSECSNSLQKISKIDHILSRVNNILLSKRQSFNSENDLTKRREVNDSKS